MASELAWKARTLARLRSKESPVFLHHEQRVTPYMDIVILSHVRANYNKGAYPMAEKPDRAAMRAAASLVREEDLEDLETLAHDLQQKADQASADGRVFLFGQYVTLLAFVNPEIARIRRRFQRESLASLRKMHKQMKEDARDQATA